jgi:hypothetical protein
MPALHLAKGHATTTTVPLLDTSNRVYLHRVYFSYGVTGKCLLTYQSLLLSAAQLDAVQVVQILGVLLLVRYMETAPCKIQPVCACVCVCVCVCVCARVRARAHRSYLDALVDDCALLLDGQHSVFVPVAQHSVA